MAAFHSNRRASRRRRHRKNAPGRSTHCDPASWRPILAHRPNNAAVSVPIPENHMTSLRTPRRHFWATLPFLIALVPPAHAQRSPDIEARLQGFDAYMGQVMKDWNVPGLGVGIVIKDKLAW